MDALQNALAMRDDLRAKLRRVEGFIENYRAFSAGDDVATMAPPRDCVRGRPAEALSEICKALTGADRPLSRREVVDVCAANGYTMPGRRPPNYVGIVAFRNGDKIEIIKGKYRLRTSLPHGGTFRHDPDCSREG